MCGQTWKNTEGLTDGCGSHLLEYVFELNKGYASWQLSALQFGIGIDSQKIMVIWKELQLSSYPLHIQSHASLQGNKSILEEFDRYACGPAADFFITDPCR